MVKQFQEPRIKRVFDLVLAPFLLIISLPLFFIIALIIIIDSGRPVFFRQVRVGRYGKPFIIYKFRTMKEGGSIITGSDDPRITTCGRWLRQLSLDELPQLINILKGEMSLIGPRPTLQYQVEKYNSRQRRRLEARPGITGWAQVNGRNCLDWPAKIELDIWYLENYSLLLDIKILLKTIKIVLFGAPIYRDYHKDPIASTSNVMIVGAGGHGKVVADILAQMNTAQVLGFLDDNPQKQGQEIMGHKITGTVSKFPAAANDNVKFLVAVGDNKTRKDIVHKLSTDRDNFINAIHPSAIISKHAVIGRGVVVMPGAVINAGAYIGNHVIVNTASSIDHDCYIHDFAHISPGARLGGNVEVGEGAQVGIGATVLPGKVIGAWSVVGAGSVVTRDIPSRTVVVGIPARTQRTESYLFE